MANAFDNDPASKWLDFANAYPGTRSSWIQYQYANNAQCVVSNYTITSGNDAASYPARNPMNWRLLGSNNGGTNWATLDIQTNQSFTASEQKLTYTITNTAAYNIYRFQIDCVSNAPSASCVQLDEIQFIGVPACTYSWTFGDGATSTLQNPQHTYAANGAYTATLVASDGTTSVTNTMTVSAWPLWLAAAPSAPGTMALTWPAWAQNCHLYTTTNLAPPISWSPATNAVTTNGGNCCVIVPVSSTSRFFQMRNP
jgi:PKD repeat protein